MSHLAYRHVDVFTSRPYSGNGLIVVLGGVDLSADVLLQITQELRQFETIFVQPSPEDHPVAARIFTIEEELPFAGHPVIGAAAALHEELANDTQERSWTFHIAGRSIGVRSHRQKDHHSATMNQGPPSAPVTLDDHTRDTFARALALEDPHLRRLPLQVLSTGLPYLIVPVTADGLARACISDPDFGAHLAAVGAKFVYVLDTDAVEGRTWDNRGLVEDVATGSAAGPAAAYLHGLGLADPAAPLELHQGRFVARPSTMDVTRDAQGNLWVGGPVAPVATGSLRLEFP